jgi:3-methyl-2-oxobutanoate hydroxymethyltransferase
LGADTENLWRISCFVTDKKHRRRGGASAALAAALESIRRKGGGVVEAYPIIPWEELCRAIKRALLVADLPYGTYHVSEDDAVRFAARFIKEGGAQAVKLEGGRTRVNLIRRMLDAEIPMMGHIGLTPQSVHRMGGYKVQGRVAADIEKLLADAMALDNAGVFAMVVEGIPCEVAKIITEQISAPTLGIGAGPDCDGQVLVLNDLLGLTFKRPPKFVRQYLDGSLQIATALAQFKADVESGAYPGDDESYHLPGELKSGLPEILDRIRSSQGNQTDLDFTDS